MRPLRVLNVCRSLDPAGGGVAEGLRQSVQATAALGHAESVLTLDAPDAPWLADFPAPVYALGPVRAGYGYHPGLVAWLRREAPAYDAVVVHGLWQYHGLAVWRALHGGPVPYFVYCHGMLDPWFKRRYPLKHLKKWLYWPWAEYRVIRDARATLFTARDEARLAGDSFWLYRVNPVVVGYGMRRPAAFDTPEALIEAAQAFAASWPDTRERRNLLFMGRLHPKKGCDLLIEAFARVAARDQRLHLVMAGPDAEGWMDTLKALAVRCGVADRISWTGMLIGEQKWGALMAAEAFVLPSHQENFGIAVAEALAVGLPVLVSERVNTWREIVEGGAGFAGPDTVEGTTALLERWLALPAAQRARLQQRARAVYAEHFDMQRVAQRYIDTLQRHAPDPALAPSDASLRAVTDSRP